MYYKVKCYPSTDTLTIQDVIFSKEKLIEPFNQKEGVTVNKIMTTDTFFTYIMDYILFKRCVIDFSQDGRVYHMTLIKDGKIYENTIEVANPSDKFMDQMEDELKRFKRHSKNAKRNLQRYIKDAPKGDMFKKSWLFLSYFDKYMVIFQIGNIDLAKIYKYAKDNKVLFKACPIKLPRSLKLLKWMFNLVTGLTFIFFSSLSILLIYAGVLPLGLITLIGGVYLMYKVGKPVYKKFADTPIELLDKFIEIAQDNIDQESLMALEKDEDIKTDFVSIVEKDLTIAKAHGEYKGFVQGLKRLEVMYSMMRHEEMGKENNIDVIDYVLELLKLEMAMYASNPRFGMTKKEPLASFEHLYDIFECFGYSKKEVRQDKFIEYIRSNISSIVENAYEGCEVEVIELIRVAAHYVRTYGLNKTSFDEEKLANLKLIVDNVFRAVCYKVKRAKELESMADKEIALEESIKRNSLEVNKHYAI